MKWMVLLGLAFLFVGCLSEPQLAMPTPSPSPVPTYAYQAPSPTPSVQATVQASVSASKAPSATPSTSFKLKVDAMSTMYQADAFKIFITNNVGEKIKFYSLTVNGSGNLAIAKSLESGAQNSLIATDAPTCPESGKAFTAKVKFEYQKVPGAEIFSETQFVEGYCQ